MEADKKVTGAGRKAKDSRRRSHQVVGVSWHDLAQIVWPIVLLSVLAIWLTLHFVSPAPPRTLTMSSGPKGSTFETLALRYRKILARDGIDLKVIESEGSLDNLGRLVDPHSGVDIAFVQSGISAGKEAPGLVSLGSMFYEPLVIFYRSAKPLQRLSELRGHRIAIGPEGSGDRTLALALLRANEIEPGGPTQLLSLEGEAARQALVNGQADAIFLTGDSASNATTRAMLHTEGIRLFDFTRADAYLRRFPYLSKLVVPAGAFDVGEDLPPVDTNLLAPTVELLAHTNLHPALCDLLVGAATEVHGHATLLQAAGTFPNPATYAFPISPEATRYYKSGDKSFLYRYLPFWLASLANRAIVVLVPIIIVVVPGLRLLPQLYRWRINLRIHRRYGELMALEREALTGLSKERRAALLHRLDQIERSTIARRMPGSHAEQVYALREHIGFVREYLTRSGSPGEPEAVHRT
ncbi:MAG TPA: TAXI family TRAP transporter solute-binding subunit [Steroidobacteraceae bacterium]|nr:TAXI family TRAP transporter solute-binding subunit [Steroidobacteraceae bacterium]